MVFNYWLSFVWYGNSKILKLPILSNEWGFNGKINVPWQPLLLLLINSITICYQFILLNRYQSTPIAHASIAHAWLSDLIVSDEEKVFKD